MKLRVRERSLRVAGFRASGIACGIKPSGRPDVALIVSDAPATAAGVFTRNRVKAAPVVIAAGRVRRGRARVLLINSGNANACTGREGRRVALATCRQAAIALGVREADVLPCSTGKIGVVLPEVPMVRGVAAAVRALAPDGLRRAARAMMTTDAFPKVAARRVTLGGRRTTIVGLAKGAGMIAPDMATLLACVITDAHVPAPVLRRLLRDGVDGSFNAITVDGDCSTNDTVLALANGRAGNAPFAAASSDGRRFGRVLAAVLGELADMVVADGEGATRRVRITVTGAASVGGARRIARAIGESQLVKAAFYGGDPNWGRIVCAAGYAGERIDPERISVHIGRVAVLRRGEPATEAMVRRAAAVMARSEIAITVDVGLQGPGRATITASDLSVDYVRFNSAYST